MTSREHHKNIELGEISEYSRENIHKAIENLESLIITLSETLVSIGVHSKDGKSIGQNLKHLISDAKIRRDQLRSVRDLHQELNIPHHQLDSLELGEHLLIQILLRESDLYKSKLIEYAQAEPTQRYSILIEILSMGGSVKIAPLLDKKEKKRAKDEADRSHWVHQNPF